MPGKVYLDRDDELWLDPGNGELLSLDEHVLRRLRDKWPERPKAEIEDEFGPLTQLRAIKRVRPVYCCTKCGKVCGTRENPKETWTGHGTPSYYCKRTCSPVRLGDR